MAIKHIIVSLHIISTDEDPGLRIESFAVINLRGVSTNSVTSRSTRKILTSVLLRPVYTCTFCCDSLLLMYVNEWISYECLDEGTCTHLLVHHQKKEIALEIAAKVASVNGTLACNHLQPRTPLSAYLVYTWRMLGVRYPRRIVVTL
jgi:hypothetical protein